MILRECRVSPMEGRFIKVTLVVSVLVFVMCIASYHIDKQASHTDEPSFSPMMSTKLAYKNEPGKEKLGKHVAFKKKKKDFIGVYTRQT